MTPNRVLPRRPRGLFIVDLDGTLRGASGRFAADDFGALGQLARRGVATAVATGRNLFSYRKAAPADWQPDYLIFSSGAGVLREHSGELLRRVTLGSDQVAHATRVLSARDLDFMVHRPVPDSHHFAFRASGGANPDFARRLELYRPFATSLNGNADRFGPASQLLAVLPPERGSGLVTTLARELPGFSVVRTTSPLDGRSTWIEIFDARASKGRAAAWLAGQLGLAAASACAVGNDYNDLDLLDWAGSAFVVADAPAELRGRFPAVAPGGRSGVAEACRRWLATRPCEEDVP